MQVPQEREETMSNTHVSLVGNLTSDPVVRQTQKGQTVLNFSLAVSETADRTSFYDVTAWNDLAHNASQTLHKGMRVVVMGMLQQSTWETNEGDKRSKVNVVADAIGPDLRWATAHVSKVANRERPQDREAARAGMQSVREALENTFPGATEVSDNGYNGEPF